MNGRPRARLGGNQKGQSTIEYLIVTFAFVAALVAVPSIYETSSDTLKNKYHSYSFAVAISDPPRKAFDDTIHHDADKVRQVLDTFEKIEDLLENSIFPDLSAGRLPAWSDIQKFGDLIKSLF